MEQNNPVRNLPNLPNLSKFDWKKNYPLILGTVAVVVVGVLTGWLISRQIGGSSSGAIPTGVKVSQDEAGIVDESTFKGDTAEGTLVEGGIGGEGTHHLERDGGASKNVYLTSSVIDLQSFVGKKVSIWGETMAAKKAGWLMDVAKVKVIQ